MSTIGSLIFLPLPRECTKNFACGPESKVVGRILYVLTAIFPYLYGQHEVVKNRLLWVLEAVFEQTCPRGEFLSAKIPLKNKSRSRWFSLSYTSSWHRSPHGRPQSTLNVWAKHLLCNGQQRSGMHKWPHVTGIQPAAGMSWNFANIFKYGQDDRYDVRPGGGVINCKTPGEGLCKHVEKVIFLVISGHSVM